MAPVVHREEVRVDLLRWRKQHREDYQGQQQNDANEGCDRVSLVEYKY